jgi:hypothetical protein
MLALYNAHHLSKTSNFQNPNFTVGPGNNKISQNILDRKVSVQVGHSHNTSGFQLLDKNNTLGSNEANESKRQRKMTTNLGQPAKKLNLFQNIFSKITKLNTTNKTGHRFNPADL